MRSRNHSWAWLACVGLLLTAGATSQAAPVQTKAVAEGMAAKMTGRPHELEMKIHRPARVTRLPAGVSAPLYGVLRLGPLGEQTYFAAVIDAPENGGVPRLWIDANANGDLTDDPPITWTKSTYPKFDGTPLDLYKGVVTLQVRYPGGIIPMRLSLLRYDVRDPNRTGYRNTLLYIADYAREADIQLGGESYHALIYDTFATGDYRSDPNLVASGVSLYLDVNHNGAYDTRGEQFDALKPFNIKGVTYELANMSADGKQFEVVVSKMTVKEEPPPPDLRVGKIVPAFTSRRMDGQTASFPTDYKGRLVMLYFWASTCAFCQTELPFVRAAYQKFHPQGLDILGVSLDVDKLDVPLPDYLAQSHMDWPQIYDGKAYAGDLVTLYYVTSTPTPYLVDGDTGKILAAGNDLRGAQLAPTLQKALNAKKTN